MNMTEHNLPAYAAKSALCACIAALLFVVALLHPTAAMANGFRQPNQDPEAIGRGNAFVATADNPAGIYYNPAGITQLDGQNVSAGLYLISGSTEFEAPSGATAQSKRDFQPVPQFYYVYAPKDFPLAFGLGVYVPFGLSVDYGTTPPFRDVAQNGSLLFATVNPTVAWKITEQVSVAVGPTINYSKVDFNRGIIFPGDQFHFVGDDFGFGMTAGARWQPCQYVAFGANYRYWSGMDYKGHSTAYPYPFPAASTTASLKFPQSIAGGISLRPTTNWNVEFDLDWTDWHVEKQALFENVAGGGNAILPLSYKSGFMYDFGVTRYLPRNFFVSLGYIYSENSSPNQFFTPLIPDSNLNLCNVGVGYKGARWGCAASYTAAFTPSRKVTDSAYGPTVDGTYHIFNNAINFSVMLKF
jgi:long-chain fatty acid transport protein